MSKMWIHVPTKICFKEYECGSTFWIHKKSVKTKYNIIYSLMCSKYRGDIKLLKIILSRFTHNIVMISVYKIQQFSNKI